jgi:hypothetical protein
MTNFLHFPDKLPGNYRQKCREVRFGNASTALWNLAKTSREGTMKTRMLVFVVPVLMVVLGWQGSLNAQCAPSGHIFNLEPRKNASFLSQFDQSLALLSNRSGSGNDLVVGSAEDARPLVSQSLTFNDAFYVGRDSSNCAAAVEGGMPLIQLGAQTLVAITINGPAVAADPAHDAFFFAAIYFAQSPDFSEVGVLKSTAADLLNTTNCPNGTLQNPVPCFEPLAGGADISPLNTLLFTPVLAVDQRKTGLGNGDVYVADVDSTSGQNQLAISACTNAKLVCGNPQFISLGQNDVDANPWIQVRPDGAVTVSYQHLIIDSKQNVILQYKFVTCAPKGAPNPPACGTPVVAAQPKNPAVDSGGETALFYNTRPTHVNRLESDSKTITTFLTFAVCEVPAIQSLFLCPKTGVVVTHSTDGKTWSPAEKVSTSPGQQFDGVMALDDSTQTVNIAYYSTEKDPDKLRTQVFLAQILPGSTSVSKPHQLTSAFYDAGIFGSFFSGYGDHIAVAAAGTGKIGESKVYVHFNGSPVDGSYNGHPFPIDTNTLTRFEY